MKIYYIYFLIFIGGSFAEDYERKFKELCKTDQLCSNLKNPDGTFIKPKQAILELVSQTSPELKEIAKKVGVSPNAVAAAILAENTMNVQADDAVQDALVKLKMAPTGAVMGKQFSIGLGQINIEPAMEAEETLAKIYGRKPRSEKEIAEKLLTTGGAYEYASGIMRVAQDCYKEQGFDISDNIPVLTSLYNLGGACARAKTSKEEGRIPKANYFGLFAEMYQEKLGKYVERQGYAEDYKESDTNKNQQFVQGIQMYQNVPECKRDGAGTQGEYSEAATYRDAVPTETASGYFRVISRDVDCDLLGWVMIQTQNGKTGWVKNAELVKKSYVNNGYSAGTYEKADGTPCPLKPQCEQKLKEILGKSYASMNGDLGLLFGKYKGEGDSKSANPKSDYVCLREDTRNSSIPAPPKTPYLTRKEINEYIKELYTLEDKVRAIVGDSSVYTRRIARLTNDFYDCMDPTNAIKCRVDPEKMKRYLNFTTTEKGFTGLNAVSAHFNANNSLYIEMESEQKIETKTETEKVKASAIFNKNCVTVGKIFPELSNYTSDIYNNLLRREKERQPYYGELTIESLDWMCSMVTQTLSKSRVNRGSRKNDKCRTNPDDYSCAVGVRVGTDNTEMSKDDIKKLAEATEEKDLLNFLKNQLSYVHATVKLDSRTCYNPLANKERFDKLFASDCVETLLVNDTYYLGAYRNDKSKKVMRFQSPNDDEFAIQVKRSCVTEKDRFAPTVEQ